MFFKVVFIAQRRRGFGILKGVGENVFTQKLKFGFGGVNFYRYFNTDVIIINIYDWIKLLYILQTALPLFNYSGRELFIQPSH